VDKGLILRDCRTPAVRTKEPAGLIPIRREAAPTQIEIKRVRFEASARLAETPGQGHYLHLLERYRKKSGIESA